MKNKKGFTLIELLAVIVILGILMFVAIPMVTTYIENSRKDAFVDNAKMAIKQARNDLLSQDAGGTCDFKQNACITMKTSEMKFEKEFTSSYGGADNNMNNSYVAVCGDVTGSKYTYYYAGVDAKGNGITNFVSEKDLDREDVKKGNQANPNPASVDGKTSTLCN